MEMLPARVLRLSVLLPLLGGVAAARAQPPAPTAEQVLQPVAVVTAEDVKKLLHTGVGVAAKMARVGGTVSGILVVSEAFIVGGKAAEAVIDDDNAALEDHLLLISRDRALLERLGAEGRLRRGDPGFDLAMAALRREQAALSAGSSSRFREAVFSRRGFLVMGKTVGRHYLTSYFGRWLGGKLADRVGLGGRLRHLALDRLARDRTVDRPTWQRASGIARTMERLSDALLVRFSVAQTVAIGAGGSGGGGSSGRVCIPGIPMLMPGPYGPTMRWTAEQCFSHLLTPEPLLPMPRMPTLVAPRAPKRAQEPIPQAPWALTRAAEPAARPVEPFRYTPAPPAPRMAMPRVVRGSDPEPSIPESEPEPSSATPPRTERIPSRVGDGDGPTLRQLKHMDAIRNWPNP